MAKETQAPIVTAIPTGRGYEKNDVRVDHPAFGVIKVTHPSGPQTLFGSDLVHHESICIEISTAHIDRSLSRDWIHADRRVVEFRMSLAQWAHFVASQGDGTGTPITFDCKPADLRWETVPGIELVSNSAQNHRKDLENHVRNAVAAYKDAVDDIQRLIDAGKANKGELRDLHARLSVLTSRLAGTAGFVMESFHKSMEETVQAAKIEVESHADHVIHRLGLDVLDGYKKAAPELAADGVGEVEVGSPGETGSQDEVSAEVVDNG